MRLYLPKDSCLISFLLAGNIQLHTILYACTKLYCRPNCSLFSIRAGADPGFLDVGLDYRVLMHPVIVLEVPIM